MLIDLSLAISADQISGGTELVQKLIEHGHAGTHFDVVYGKFSLENFRTNGKVIDISHIRDREVEVTDLSDVPLEKGDTVIFHTGYVEELGYDITTDYVEKSAELSDEAVAYVVDRGVSLICVDAVGLQNNKKHHAVDKYCGDRGIFIVENLNNVGKLLDVAGPITIYTAPLPRVDLSGLPCRVVAEVAG